MTNPVETIRKALEDIVADLALVPDDEIAGVRSFGYVDGRTFMCMLDTVGGDTLIVMATPGEPLRVRLHGGTG